jgi:hypothetical protein
MNLFSRFSMGTLLREDRPVWAAARTVQDLAELTAQWLEGRLQSQPGYYGPVDVDESDAPGLTATLVAANRVGFLTNCSQCGFDGLDQQGNHWKQYAAVTGFMDREAAQRLASAIRDYGFAAAAPGMGRPITVTWRNGSPLTSFHTGFTRRVVSSEMYSGCSRKAINAVMRAEVLTIWDPNPGRNTLWQALASVVSS